jgi:ubiquinol oxidase
MHRIRTNTLIVCNGKKRVEHRQWRPRDRHRHRRHQPICVNHDLDTSEPNPTTIRNLPTTLDLRREVVQNRPTLQPKIFARTVLNSERGSKNYGFRTTQIIVDSEIPKPIWKLAIESMIREMNAGRQKNHFEEYLLTLDTKALWEMEKKEQNVQAPAVMMVVYYVICYMLDLLYQKDPISRFAFLETLARQPYFSYVALYHFYETIGFWSIASYGKTLHLQQENNECAHLKIMEELGGSKKWKDRFLSRHASIAYFLVLLVFYMISPRLAYKSSELLESHAQFTYKQFILENKEVLKTMPVPVSANDYVPMLENAREMKNLYDVFCNIMDDEITHSETMEFIIGHEGMEKCQCTAFEQQDTIV